MNGQVTGQSNYTQNTQKNGKIYLNKFNNLSIENQ